MSKTIRIVPIRPLGPYPQPPLYLQLGNDPIKMIMRITTIIELNDILRPPLF